MSNSYKIGQMVLTNKDLKLIPITSEIKSYSNNNIPMAVFVDKYIIPNKKFKNENNYYLSAIVKADGEYSANCQVKLVEANFNNSEAKFEKERIIKKDLIITKEAKNVNLIFSPIEDDVYNAIVFEIVRDENEIKEDRIFIGRELTIEPIKTTENNVEQDLPILQTIGNILEVEEKDDNGNVIKVTIPYIVTELGLQGEPGQLFTIEGEEIRIGKSGVYEMHFENIGINNIGIIPQGNTLILDYKYKEAK